MLAIFFVFKPVHLYDVVRLPQGASKYSVPMRTFVLIVRTSNHHRTVPGTVYLLLFYFSNSLGGRVDEGGPRVDHGWTEGSVVDEGGPRVDRGVRGVIV